MSSLIEAVEIRRSFTMGARTLDVLRGVSLAVAEGESLAVTGMSGAGKSTLLHVLGGLDRPTSGRMFYRGRDFYAAGDRERSAIRAQKIGFVFQADHLLPELTVLENVLLPGLSLHGAFLRGGKLRERASLEALPGVGRKTANVVMNTAFGEPTMAVDTHIFRVSNRTGIAPGKNVDIVEQKLLKFIPKEFLHDAHHWLILHGRYTCTARKPQCWNCMIADLCDYKDKSPMPAVV